MILKHHTYRLAVNTKVQASAGSLADCQTMADYLFLRDPLLDEVAIFAWCCDHPERQAGWTMIQLIHNDMGRELKLELKQPGYLERRAMAQKAIAKAA